MTTHTYATRPSYARDLTRWQYFWLYKRHRFLNAVGLITLQLALTAFLITFLVPTLWMVVSAFKSSTEIFMQPIVWIPKEPHLRNFTEAFRILPLTRFAWNTFFVVAMAVTGTLISSAMVGYSFARLRWPGRDFFFALMIGTVMLPGVVMLIPRFLIFRSLGWIDTLAPLIVPFWLGGSPFYIFLMRQFLRGLPYDLDEAAIIDGASHFQIFSRILLPLCKPVIATITVFSVLEHYNSFLEPLIYLNRMSLWTLALGIRAFNDSYAARWELIFSASTVMLIPVVVLFIFAQRYFVQGIAMTGLKG